ncbi:MAG TPA: hypothetical protein VN626_11775 [Clostridia bacterium]|nr:hypothetical protein [Clostridia bacterium]
MINSKERTHLNMIKRLFCLLIVAMMVATMLPATVYATNKEVVSVIGDLEVYGNPNSQYPIGSGYRVEVVQNPNGLTGLYLQLSYPGTSNRDPEIISRSLFDSQDYVIYNGITFQRDSDKGNKWQTGWYSTFGVADDDSDTTVSSNNITLLNITKNKIKESTEFKVTLQIIDYNVDDGNVDDGVVPYLTGYNSSGSFILLDSALTFERMTHDTGKYAFKVTLPLKYTGTGNSLSFTLAYKNSQGTLRTIDCTTTIPRTVATTEDDDDDDDDTESDNPVPYIIVDSYSYGGSSVTAGDQFTLKVKLRNTSSTNSLVNIVMNVSPMGVFSMASSSNTSYITQLQPGSIIEREIILNAGLTKVTDDKDANSIDIKFTYQYTGTDVKKLLSGSSSESITLPVDFPDRFELSAPESDDTAYIGEDYYVSVPMVNKGRSVVYNLTAFVRGDGIKNPGQTQYIGNLAAGTESSADFSLQYLEPGVYSGEIVVTYEDANMNPKETISVFNVTVEDMGFGESEPEFPGGVDPNEPTEPANAEPKTDPVMPVKIVVGLIVGVMSAYVTIQKAKAKRSIYLDEDL